MITITYDPAAHVLVPKKMTGTMMGALEEALSACRAGKYQWPQDVWDALLAASPEIKPQPQQGALYAIICDDKDMRPLYVARAIECIEMWQAGTLNSLDLPEMQSVPVHITYFAACTEIGIELDKVGIKLNLHRNGVESDIEYRKRLIAAMLDAIPTKKTP